MASDTDASFEQRGLQWLGKPQYCKHVCLLTPCLWPEHCLLCTTESTLNIVWFPARHLQIHVIFISHVSWTDQFHDHTQLPPSSTTCLKLNASPTTGTLGSFLGSQASLWWMIQVVCHCWKMWDCGQCHKNPWYLLTNGPGVRWDLELAWNLQKHDIISKLDPSIHYAWLWPNSHSILPYLHGWWGNSVK